MKPLGTSRVSTRLALFAGLWAALFIVAPAPVAGHELTENRATVVKREDRHLSMALYLDMPEVLAKMLAPGRPFNEFVLAYSAMPEADFARQAAEAEQQLQSATRIVDRNGAGPMIAQWRWPDGPTLQRGFREIAAQMLTSPDGTHHDEPDMIQAEFLMPTSVDMVRLTFPEQLQPVLIVSYAPKQAWSEPDRAAEIGF